MVWVGGQAGGLVEGRAGRMPRGGRLCSMVKKPSLGSWGLTPAVPNWSNLAGSSNLAGELPLMPLPWQRAVDAAEPLLERWVQGLAASISQPLAVEEAALHQVAEEARALGLDASPRMLVDVSRLGGTADCLQCMAGRQVATSGDSLGLTGWAPRWYI